VRNILVIYTQFICIDIAVNVFDQNRTDRANGHRTMTAACGVSVRLLGATIRGSAHGHRSSLSLRVVVKLHTLVPVQVVVSSATDHVDKDGHNYNSDIIVITDSHGYRGGEMKKKYNNNKINKYNTKQKVGNDFDLHARARVYIQLQCNMGRYDDDSRSNIVIYNIMMGTRPSIAY